jgi:hypothetical protein
VNCPAALRRTVFRDGERRPDDYEVRCDGRTVGPILRLRSIGRELWQWTQIDIPAPSYGPNGGIAEVPTRGTSVAGSDTRKRPRSANSRTPRRGGIKGPKATEGRLSQKKIPALRVAEAQDEGGLWPGKYARSLSAERRSAGGCGKSSPAEAVIASRQCFNLNN